MKRLILMGGRPWLARDGGEYFAQVLFRYYPQTVKVAACIFAQQESDWKETAETNRRMLDRFKGNRTITLQIMTRDNFEELSAWADVIYIPGGDPRKLLDELQSYDLDNLWNNKVIAGSSAGANLFCKAFISLSSRTWGTALGWLPTICIPHWRDNFENFTAADWDWAEQTALREYPDTPVLCIPEGTFVEYTVQ